ncbi:MAG: rhamnulokinase family protein [Opitutales bacterium]
MKSPKTYLAVDLGAGSGRVLAAEFDGSRLRLNALNRFDNTPVVLPSGSHWNLSGLFLHILDGLREAATQFGDAPVSVGVDTWGVDYGLLDASGHLLGLPYQYRDTRVDGMMDRVFKIIPQREIYDRTGLQFLPFNTIYQLFAEREARAPVLDAAQDLLFIPDLLSYWLSGERIQERTFASTSQLYHPQARDWDRALITALGLPQHLFRELTDPATRLGKLRDVVAEATGLRSLSVVTVAGHDTASAVAGVPSEDEPMAYLSSGTWSLMGLELPEPVINDQSFADGITNEIGIGHTVRFLKNICGLWLTQESRRYWQGQGSELSFARLEQLAAEAEPFRSFIDPDDARFAQAGRMPEKIADFCRESGQPVPEGHAQVMRCIYDSLALKYAHVWKRLCQHLPKPPARLHLIGGGSQDNLLNQCTANALGVPVLAGPVEATALGNVLAQMLADGAIGSLHEGRHIIADSFPTVTFRPQEAARWAEAYGRFAALLLA